MAIAVGEVSRPTLALQLTTNSRDTAIPFLYFETLYSLGDRNKIEAEVQRMTALNSFMVQAGYPEIIFADFAECTIELLQKTLDAILNSSGDQFITDYFNDESSSSAIIMHFRVSNTHVLMTIFTSFTSGALRRS